MNRVMKTEEGEYITSPDGDNATQEEIIKYIISEDDYDSNYLIDELESISHKASLGAGRDKVLYNIMVDCKKLKEKIYGMLTKKNER